MWSAGRNEDIMFSPFRFCNGTLTVESHHSFSSYSADEDLGEIVFLDFAGSGVVHLCGKLIYSWCLLIHILRIIYKVEQQHLFFKSFIKQRIIVMKKIQRSIKFCTTFENIRST